MTKSVIDTESGRKTARVSPKVAKRIEKVVADHQSIDERRPPRAWTKTPDRDLVDADLIDLINRYEAVAPYLSAPTVKALRRMLVNHPYLRLRGKENAAAQPNYRLPNGTKFYWGGVRRLADGSLRAGGVGRKPRVLEEYERSPEGQKRIAAGEPTFLPIE